MPSKRKGVILVILVLSSFSLLQVLYQFQASTDELNSASEATGRSHSADCDKHLFARWSAFVRPCLHNFTGLQAPQCEPPRGIASDGVLAAIEDLRQTLTKSSALKDLATNMWLKRRTPDGMENFCPGRAVPFESIFWYLRFLLTRGIEFVPEGRTGRKPLSTVFACFMYSPEAMEFLKNETVNEKVRKIANAWSTFLDSPASVKVLHNGTFGWMSSCARSILNISEYEHNTTAPNWGFKSWNDFFLRKVVSHVRPIDHPLDDLVVTSPVDASVQRIELSIRENPFWIKGEAYSLSQLLESRTLAAKFTGGSVLQSYLSLYNYHRYHSPVSGKILDAYVISGVLYPMYNATYNRMYAAHFSSRAVFLIDNPVLGLVAFVAIGMVEVSSCNIRLGIKRGVTVRKGEEIGHFKNGGSTTVLALRRVAVQMKLREPFWDVHVGEKLRMGQSLVNLRPVPSGHTPRHLHGNPLHSQNNDAFISDDVLKNITSGFELELKEKMSLTPEMYLQWVERLRPPEKKLINQSALFPNNIWMYLNRKYPAWLFAIDSAIAPGISLHTELSSRMPVRIGTLAEGHPHFLTEVEDFFNSGGLVQRSNSQTRRRNSKCHVHVTFGVPLKFAVGFAEILTAAVPPTQFLFQANETLQQRIRDSKRNLILVRGDTQQRLAMDPDEYISFVSLVVHVAEVVTRCRGNLIAKFCFAKGFLVRTNFGDMFNYLTRNVESSAKDVVVHQIVNDIGDLAKKKLYPRGSLCFQDMKEHAEAFNLTMPKLMSNRTELLEFAKKIVAAYSRPQITNWAIANRRYKGNLTVRKWILAFRKGKDLMSDRDSIIAQKGKVPIFKAMGGRSILPGGNVLIEIRRTRYNRRVDVPCDRASNYFKHVAQSILKRTVADEDPPEEDVWLSGLLFLIWISMMLLCVVLRPSRSKTKRRRSPLSHGGDQ